MTLSPATGLNANSGLNAIQGLAAASGLTALASATPSATIDFNDGIPTGLTETATSTISTYHDNTGALQSTVSTVPTIDYGSTGTIGKLHTYLARTNVCTNTNSGVPGGITNMTLTDLGTGASLAVSTDTTFLRAASSYMVVIVGRSARYLAI